MTWVEVLPGLDDEGDQTFARVIELRNDKREWLGEAMVSVFGDDMVYAWAMSPIDVSQAIRLGAFKSVGDAQRAVEMTICGEGK